MSTSLQQGLFDVESHTTKLTEMGDPPVGLNAQIDWKSFRSDLNRVHAESRSCQSAQEQCWYGAH